MYVDWDDRNVKVYDDNSNIVQRFINVPQLEVIQNAVCQGDKVIVTTDRNIYVYQKDNYYNFTLKNIRSR